MSTSRRVRRHRRPTSIVLSAVAIAVATTSALAIDITVNSNSMELQKKTDGSYTITQAQPQFGMRLGYQSNYGSGSTATGGMNGLLYFAMPAHAADEVVATATLRFSENRENSGSATIPTFNIDLYGLGFDTNNPPTNEGIATSYTNRGGIPSTHLSQNYFYSGPAQTGTTPTTGMSGVVGMAISKLQDDILVPADWTDANLNAAGPTNGTGTAVHTTSAAGANGLAAFVQSAIGSGIATGNYLMLRMTPDVTGITSGTKRYYIPYVQTPSESDSSSPNATVPTLTLTFAKPGDANSDGKIDADDYALIDRGQARFTSGAIAGGNTQWSDGDFNHDGSITADDYLVIDTAYAAAHPMSPDFLAQRASEFGAGYVASLVAAVPEPTSLAACGAAGLALAVRRRRA